MAEEERIAILVDSCSDVPRAIREQYNMYLAPQILIYPEGEYRDGIDLKPSQVYSRFPDEIPSTSLPDMATVTDIVHQIKHDGYNRIAAFCISSGLSGTANLFRLVPPPEGMRIEVVDSLNIGIGSGFNAILGAKLIEAGMKFDELIATCREQVANSKLFINFAMLDYLRKGGRIGRVAGLVGSLLDIKPIVSCDENGIYYPVAKAKGRKRQLRTALKEAVEFAKGWNRYNLTVMHADSPEEAAEVEAELKRLLPNYEMFIGGELTPALVVHTGPQLIGIGVQRLPDFAPSFA